MKVKLGQAVKMFFGNSSLEMVYFESIANSLDANATEININISAKSPSDPESIMISVEDNGIGFTDDRYKKFSKLFDVDEKSHKGLGRLVYLCYFETIRIESYYNKKFKREFTFNENFEEDNCKISPANDHLAGTIISMNGYLPTRLRSHSFINPKYLKSRILEEFYSKFFQLINNGQSFKLTISAEVNGIITTETISNSDIPKFEMVTLDSEISLIDQFNLFYFITEIEPLETSLIAAIVVDNRSIKIEIISEENKPLGFKMVFLLFSEWFAGKVDASRQNIEITDIELNTIESQFRRKVAEIIESRIPKIKERNLETKNNLINRYPHLNGYFNIDSIGYVTRTEILKKAQDLFFKAQRELLDSTSLNDEQFEKSMELSARALTEYILFRQLIINQLKNTNKDNDEYDIHNLFVTRREKFDKVNLQNDIYRNNAWLLDDKYMTYETILSEKELGELVEYITEGEIIEKESGRPDIALVFSNDPNSTPKFDVVIVELKKRGLKLEENMVTATQLEKRARKLMKYYNDKIQRIWYYGIIEFNDELELHLSADYKQLYSIGKIYYRDTSVVLSKSPEIRIPIGIYLWDIDALVADADARNSTFLKLIKSKFTQ